MSSSHNMLALLGTDNPLLCYQPYAMYSSISFLNKELTSLKGIVNKDSEIKKSYDKHIPRKMLHPRVIWTRIAVMHALQSWVEREGGWSWLGGERGREQFVKY